MAPSGWPGGSGGGSGGGGTWPPTGSGSGSGAGGWPPAGGAGWPPQASGAGGAWPPANSPGSGGAGTWPPSSGQPWPPAAGGPSWPPATGTGTQAPAPPDWAAGFTPAGGDEAKADARPPLGLLYVGFLGPVIALVLLFLWSGWIWNVVGWLVSLALGLGMLVAFTGADLRRRANPWYLARPGLVGGLRLAVAAAAIVVAGIHAYLFADYIARLDVWVS